jgi:thiol-disulfide isomerase/thioredoxin
MTWVLRAALGLALGAACHGDEPVAPESRGKVELIETPKGSDVAKLVVPQLASAQRDHKRVVVYVGAEWCEPCVRFHKAAQRGELDGELGGTRFLVFDLDRDGEALERANYRSTYVPLFAIPGDDGKASGRQIEGSIKGDGAIGEIAPRLRALIGP